MQELDELVEKALGVLESWTWISHDPGGKPFEPGLSLSEVVNRLAMEGIVRPQDCLLRLLCDGRLQARGDCHWKKYQHFDHFYLDSYSALIPKQRWEKLGELITTSRRSDDSWIETTVQLEELGLHDCEEYEWKPTDDRFHYAICTDGFEKHEAEYTEEFFSSWKIEVWPSDYGETSHSEPTKSNADQDRLQVRGRRPAQWWPDFAEELAIFIHEEGVPEGSGTEGQDQMIAAIFRRMNEQGKVEGSRTTVQPVISAVLRRLRRAGN